MSDTCKYFFLAAAVFLYVFLTFKHKRISVIFVKKQSFSRNFGLWNQKYFGKKNEDFLKIVKIVTTHAQMSKNVTGTVAGKLGHQLFAKYYDRTLNLSARYQHILDFFGNLFGFFW